MAAATVFGTLLRRVHRGTRELRIDPEHRRDGAGLAAFGGAILAMAAVWFHAGGPVGEILDTALRLLVGAGALLLPVIGAAAAWRLVRAPADPDSRGRVVIGWSATTLGVLGFYHLVRGTPDFSDGTQRLRSAGGVTGFVAASPLGAAVTPYVAAPLLILLTLFGLLVITRTPLRQVPELARGLADRLASGLREDRDERYTRAGPGGRPRPDAAGGYPDEADDLSDDELAGLDGPVGRGAARGAGGRPLADDLLGEPDAPASTGRSRRRRRVGAAAGAGGPDVYDVEGDLAGGIAGRRVAPPTGHGPDVVAGDILDLGLGLDLGPAADESDAAGTSAAATAGRRAARGGATGRGRARPPPPPGAAPARRPG
ncbi:MAG: DNA translocase FtsK 4TM domain-containing protein, partial [Frankia sp.]|nr:DNA translocase FtsK 4TM domain-containing protein [Frankia sp.]